MTQREISREMKNDYLNNKADIVGQNLWEKDKAMVRGKLVELNSWTYEEEKPAIYSLCSHNKEVQRDKSYMSCLFKQQGVRE